MYRYKDVDEKSTKNWHGYYWARRTERRDYEILTVPSSLGNHRRRAASSRGRALRSTTKR
jgi:hypothetical protein